MLTVTGGDMAGTATITVTATDADGSGMTATQMFDVTVGWTLTAPTNLLPNPVGSGIVRLGWDAVPGAAGYYAIAVAPGDASDFNTAILNYPPGDKLEVAINQLTQGQEYTVFRGRLRRRRSHGFGLHHGRGRVANRCFPQGCESSGPGRPAHAASVRPGTSQKDNLKGDYRK